MAGEHGRATPQSLNPGRLMTGVVSTLWNGHQLGSRFGFGLPVSSNTGSGHQADKLHYAKLRSNDGPRY